MKKTKYKKQQKKMKSEISWEWKQEREISIYQKKRGNSKPE